MGGNLWILDIIWHDGLYVSRDNYFGVSSLFFSFSFSLYLLTLRELVFTASVQSCSSAFSSFSPDRLAPSAAFR